MTMIRAFLQKMLVAIFAIFIAMPCFAENDDNRNIVSRAATTVQTSVAQNTGSARSDDIGDFGMWATDHNRELVVGKLATDLKEFGPTETSVENGFVPLDAKLGLAFIGGLANLGIPLDRALSRFAIIFILVAYAFWVAFTAYNLITSGSTGNAKETIRQVILKGMVISAWLIVLDFGIVRVFAIIMMPIVELGLYISHTIWQGITATAGLAIPDKVCDAIQQYASTHIIDKLPNVQNDIVSSGLIDSLKSTSNSTVGLLCIPSQMSAFFVTIIEIGWGMVVKGIGVSLLSVVLGLYITYLGFKCIWKFLFITLGVVADIFFGLLLLPFTAVAETTAKTNYKGVAGDIFNSFLEIFKTNDLSLKKQINRIIQALLYFICLGITVGVSVALLSFIINPATGQISEQLQIDGLGGIIILILMLLLVCYMADKAQKLATDWGGKIDTSFGDKFQKDIETLLKILKTRLTKKKSGTNNSSNGDNGKSASGGDDNGSGKGSSKSRNPLTMSDLAILGLPQSGKYTLFKELTNSQWSINSQYSHLPIRFGYVNADSKQYIATCLPALSGGLYPTIGAGNRFLVYAEKCRLLLHLIDATEPDWESRYTALRNDLNAYTNILPPDSALDLPKKPEIIVITKASSISDAELNTRIDTFKQSFASDKIPPIVPVCANTGRGMSDLLYEIKKILR